jgi:site-specific DNA-methyltransferase (adenine-specific)
MTALAIPDPTPGLDVEALAASVPAMLAAIELIDDIAHADEMRARAAALEEYLTRRGLDQIPGWAIARNLEARIGALLGPADGPGPSKSLTSAGKTLHHARRNEFRLLHQYREAWEKAPGPRPACLTLAKRARAKTADANARAIEQIRVDDVETDRWAMLAGDIVDRAADLAPASVDLIVTDPPYPTELLPLWSDLAEVAGRLLKPQAILVALSGKIILPDVIDRLREHLAYGWVYCQPLPGSSSRILARHVGQEWKPWLAFSNGPWPSGRVDWHPDILDGHPLSKDRFHWEQSTGPAVQLIHYLAPENGLVLDPFAGTATYGVAALQTGRRFIGIEVDHDRYQTCCERLYDL